MLVEDGLREVEVGCCAGGQGLRKQVDCEATGLPWRHRSYRAGEASGQADGTTKLLKVGQSGFYPD